jgi:mRNA interferase HigB
MILIGKKIIVDFGNSHPPSRKSLAAWEQAVKQTNYASFNELKLTFPSVDYVYHQYTFFDIGGNKYRLFSDFNYESKLVCI